MAIRIPLIQINGRLAELPIGDKFDNSIVDTFVYTQTAPSNIWVIVHSMGKYPSVSVVLNSGEEVYGSKVYTDNNIVTLTFSKAIAGQAFLN